MTWSEYMITVAAPHSRNNAKHWLRYLSKDIEKCGTIFSKQDIEDLYNNEELSYFQRVSIKAAFKIDSPTRQHIISLNNKTNLDMITAVKNKIRGDTK